MRTSLILKEDVSKFKETYALKTKKVVAMGRSRRKSKCSELGKRELIEWIDYIVKVRLLNLYASTLISICIRNDWFTCG